MTIWTRWRTARSSSNDLTTTKCRTWRRRAPHRKTKLPHQVTSTAATLRVRLVDGRGDEARRRRSNNLQLKINVMYHHFQKYACPPRLLCRRGQIAWLSRSTTRSERGLRPRHNPRSGWYHPSPGRRFPPTR